MSQEEWFRFNSDGEPISSFVIKEWDEGDDEDFEDTSYRSYRNNSDFFPRRDY